MTLAAVLAARIAADGPLPLDRYLDACLADPVHGYYRGRDRLGRAGDFVTAPEISQTFGELLGLWAAETWRRMGAPQPVLLAELGPGRGTLMADALRAIGQAAPAFRAALRLHLVEISPGFRAQQRAALGAAPVWHERVDELPPGPAIVLANEFLDALPVRQFVRREDGWRERAVDCAAGRFFWTELPATDPPLEPAQRDAPVGATVEVSPAVCALVAGLAARLARDGGAALIVDYGRAESGAGGTLQAVRAHKPADPLAEPGLADLTAHVDFAAVARAARAAGVPAFGPVPQGEFLHRLGLAARVAALVRHARGRVVRDIVRGVERLIDPGQMGTLFKALALGPGTDPPPGFEGG